MLQHSGEESFPDWLCKFDILHKGTMTRAIAKKHIIDAFGTCPAQSLDEAIRLVDVNSTVRLLMKKQHGRALARYVSYRRDTFALLFKLTKFRCPPT